MIELNNNNPKQCDKCIHNRVCNLKDKLKAYIEEYDVLNEKYGDLFPKNPNCPEYLSNGSINKHYPEIPKDEGIKKRAYEHLVKTSDEKDKYLKESKKSEERKPLDKSKIFYYNLDDLPKSNLNFVNEDECCNKKQLTEEDIIKVLERVLGIG